MPVALAGAAAQQALAQRLVVQGHLDKDTPVGQAAGSPGPHTPLAVAAALVRLVARLLMAALVGPAELAQRHL
jgi:hypothetical protein